ncbi:MAG: site-2 protease family protein [Gemmatimonadaceae bacterium]
MSKLELFVLVAPVLLFSMVAHEYAHGYAALRQGDNTAQSLGRLTWNPLKHIDPVMTLIMPVITFLTIGVAFGGAKPVPVDPRNYRNYRRGDIIVSLAGVVTNLALAVILTLLIIPLGLVGRAVSGAASALALLQLMFLYGVVINLLLAGFNLIPIPPLDGSHVLKHLLPPKLAWQYQRFGKYGILLLIALLWLGNGATINWLMQPVTFLQNIAVGVVHPFVLASPWTT